MLATLVAATLVGFTTATVYFIYVIRMYLLKHVPQLTMEELLNKWEIEESIITKFKENGLEVQHLKYLTDNLLKELCPAIGIRIFLKNKIEEYLTATTDTASVSTVASIETVTDSDIFDNSALDNISVSDLFTPTTPIFPEFELKTLLNTSPCGKSILQYYELNKCLTNRHRSQLTDIIIRHIFTYVVNHRITYENYNILTAKIISLFPKENSGTYFVPPIKKRDSINSRPTFAKGKLVDKVKNILYKSGEKRRSLSAKSDENPEKKKKIAEELKESNGEMIAWLKNNKEPWDQVIKFWKATYNYRSIATYEKVTDFINDWPVLNDPRADILINNDFDNLYPSRNCCLYAKWDSFIDKVIKSRPNIKDEVTLSLITEIQSFTANEEDNKIIAQIKLLCHLIPPRGRLNKKTKFSILECQEGFVVHVQNPGDISTKIEEISTKASQNLKCVQPYILYCGNEENYKFYLVVDKIRYTFSSAIKSLDTLFKCYHTFHASYPLASDHIYLLIQRCVYNIHTIFDKVVPYIADLLTEDK